MHKIISTLFTIFICTATLFGQQPKKLNSSEIYHSLQKLNFLGSALYIAAHPDDENTRLISYLSNDVHARTAYLSITRGDGGQNLVGPEIRELLGDRWSEDNPTKNIYATILALAEQNVSDHISTGARLKIEYVKYLYDLKRLLKSGFGS